MLYKKYFTILYIMGSLILVIGLILLIPLIFSLYLREGSLIYISFLIPSLFSICTGFLLSRIKPDNIKIDLSTGMILCTFGWLISSIIGSIPFVIGINKSFVDALFEAISGFTTTGITVFQNLNQLPHSILLWRSLIQWLGGLGILTFFLLITFRSEEGIWKLFTAESHKISNTRPVPNIFKSIEILWGIYLLYSIIQFVLLVILNVNVFDAVIHSLTTISTGGFSNYDSSIAQFKNSGYTYYKAIEYVIIFFMLMGGINFLIHYKLLTGKIKEVITNCEIKYFFKIIIIVFFIMFFGYYLSAGSFDITSIEEVFRKTLFQIVAIITTTGYETQNIGSAFFPVVARQLFLILMLIGGCVGSTAGGVKVMRIMVLNRLFSREIKKIQSPKRYLIPVTVENQIISKEEILRISAIFFAWLFLIIIGGTITALFSDLSAGQSISGMFSAVGNIGPFYFSVEEMSSLSPIIKITYMIGMLAGRLEILPVMILFTGKAWK